MIQTTDHAEGQTNWQARLHKLIPLFCLAATIGLVPLLMYFRVEACEDSIVKKLQYGSQAYSVNLFTHYKAIWLYILIGTAAFLHLRHKRVENHWSYLPLVIYFYFAMLSTVFSQHSTAAIWGHVTRNEGLITIASYILTTFLFIGLTTTQKISRYFSIIILTSATIISFLGLLQFFGYDPLSNQQFIAFLTPEHATNLLPGIGVRLPGDFSNAIYGTFGNGNIAGSYMAMLFPFSLALLIGAKGRWKYLILTLNAMFYFNLLGCQSRAGQLGAFLSTMIILFVLRHRLRENFRYLAILVLSFVFIPFIMDAHTLKTGKSGFFTTSLFRPAVTQTHHIIGNLDDLAVDRDSVSIVFDGTKLKIANSKDGLEFYDQNGEIVPYNTNLVIPISTQTSSISDHESKNQESSSPETLSPDVLPGHEESSSSHIKALKEQEDPQYHIVFPSDRLRGFTIYVWPRTGIMNIYRSYGVNLFVRNTEEGFKLYDTKRKDLEIKDIESFGFKGYEKFASSRGYIWSRTIPILKKTIFIGYGPDTFAAHFPNHDYIGKLKFLTKGLSMHIDKPHNLYLQVAVNTGVISLIALLYLFVKYLYDSAKIYLTAKTYTDSYFIGIAIASAIFAYLVAGFFNDSEVSIAPVFWGLLGMGIAVNRINAGENSLTEKCCEPENQAQSNGTL